MLYLVATPIGNLGDISARALETLRTVDSIAVEDTRRAGQLLAHFDIKQKLIAYHDHNEGNATPKLVSRMLAGEAIALISDAGLPLIADPGHRLVAACAGAGVPVTVIPGANAALMALMLSALPSDRFYFHGFLPAKPSARRTELAQLAGLSVTLIFYEAPHRLLETLIDAESVLGNRRACVGRELTKLYEEARRGSVSELAAHYEITPPRGECVLVIEGQTNEATLDADGIDALLLKTLSGMKLRDAAKAVAAQTGLAVSDLYARALQLQDKA